MYARTPSNTLDLKNFSLVYDFYLKIFIAQPSKDEIFKRMFCKDVLVKINPLDTEHFKLMYLVKKKKKAERKAVIYFDQRFNFKFLIRFVSNDGTLSVYFYFVVTEYIQGGGTK